MITTKEIDNILSGADNRVIEACAEIADVQHGKIPLLKLGIEHLDNTLVSGASNQMIFIGARPSQGKTYTSAVIKKSLLDETLNKGANIRLLNLDWEMTLKSTVLRAMQQKLGKGIKDILNNKFNAEEKEKVTQTINNLMDPRALTFDQVVTGENFRHLIENYIAKGPQDEVVVLIDHIHVILTKKEIDEFLSLCNELKKKHKNLTFIIFFQLNRELERAWRGSIDAKVKTNPKSYVPNSSHIYNTDSLYQFADLIMTQVIPQVVGLDEYTSVHRERNDHLSEHFVDDSTDNKSVRLKGRNRIYYNYIKIRLNDDFSAPRMFCDIIDFTKEDEITKQYYSEEAKIEKKAPTFKPKKTGPPEFDMTTIVIPNNKVLEAARGNGFEEGHNVQPEPEENLESKQSNDNKPGVVEAPF